MITWIAESKVFTRIVLLMNGVRLGWFRMRENFVACDLNDSRTDERKQRLALRQQVLNNKIDDCEQFGEFLRRQIKGEAKKPDIKRVA